jgi:molecular chaperone HtpG
MPEYIEKYGEKTDQKILYASDEQSQATILDMLRENDMDAVLAPTMIDQHFIQYVEMYSSGKFKFERVDANVAKHLTADNLSSQILDPKDAKNQSEKIGDIFRQHLSREKVKVRVEPLKTTGIPAMLLFDENIRRMQEMAAMNPGSFRHMPTESEHTLVINLSNPAIKHLLTLAETFHGEEKTKLVVNQIYDLAFLQQGQFTPEMMRSFVERSTKILQDFGGASPNKVILETSL